MGQRSCRRGILVPLKRRLCCAVFLAWLCASFGQVQAALLGITPCWGTIPLTWARGAGSPHTSSAGQHVPGRGLRGSSGEAPRPLPTVLLLTVPGQRCALVPAQERGTGTQTRSGTGSVTMGAAGVGCSLLLGPFQSCTVGLKQLLGACSCVPISCQPAAAPCKFFHPVKLGS